MDINRLRHYREEALLTQRELAARAGTSQACIAYIETGARAGRWNTRKKLARALNVPEAEVFPDLRAA